MSTDATAVENAINRSDVGDKAAALQQYQSAVRGKDASITDMRKAARDILGREVGWDWELPRTREGY